MTDEQVQEAAYVAGEIVGFSALLHGMDYDLDQYLRELDESLEYIKKQAASEGAKPSAEKKAA